MSETLSQKKLRHLNSQLTSGSKTVAGTAQKAAIDKQGHLYKLGSNDTNNFFSDKNGKVLKQNNIVKFTPAFFRFQSGNWQMYPSASAGRSEGDGEIVLVNDTNNWNYRFDSTKYKNFVSSSFIEFVDDGPQ